MPCHINIMVLQENIDFEYISNNMIYIVMTEKCLAFVYNYMLNNYD